MRQSTFFKIGLLGVSVILFSCFVLPFFSNFDPIKNSLTERFIPPEGFSKGFSGHIFGTDALGRDMFIRLMIGGQLSIRISFISVILQTIISVTLGLLAGYFGGIVDIIIMRACDVLLSIPNLILSIAIIAIFGASITNLIIVLTFTGWVTLCKVIRNDVRIFKRQEFIMASQALGARGFHIMFKQILPNATTNMIIISSQRIGVMILFESGLSFLNLGILPPDPSWGNMLSAGRSYLTTQPWICLVPGIALMLTVLSFNFMGDGIRDVLDTKRKV